MIPRRVCRGLSAAFFVGFCDCSVPSQLQAKIHAESPLAMGFLLGRGTLSYGQRSESADLLNSDGDLTVLPYHPAGVSHSNTVIRD